MTWGRGLSAAPKDTVERVLSPRELREKGWVLEVVATVGRWVLRVVPETVVGHIRVMEV